MNIEAISSSGNAAQSRSMVSDRISTERKEKDKEKVADTPQASPVEKQVQPEELLNQIKAVTEDSTYSVRFERNDNAELIVKIFDSSTEELVRQLPSEEILQLRETLEDLRGNILNTEV
jgi:flagellar protein FlaG